MKEETHTDPLRAEPPPHPPAAGRSGMVAVVGRANVGKSTLVNQVLQEKISIVSPTVQTTRNAIRGVLTEPRGQLVFIDTPGVHHASKDLGRIMNRRARASVQGVDVVLLLFDVTAPPQLEDEGWMRRLAHQEAACFGVLNKIDQGTPCAGAYRARWSDLAKEKPGAKAVRWLSLSAETGEGVPALLEALFETVPEGPPLFPEDVLTDFPRKLAIADFIREKLLRDLREELPHSVAVFVESLDEVEGEWLVSAVVYVQKPSQKGIVIGHKGRKLRRVRRASEQELSAVYDRPVKVSLRVKIEKHWDRNFWMLKKLGHVD